MATVHELNEQTADITDGIFNARRRFNVRDVGGSYEGQEARALEVSGLPRSGQGYPGRPKAKVQSLSATRKRGAEDWFIVEVAYSEAASDGSETLSIDDPVEISVQIVTVTEIVTRDRQGFALTTDFSRPGQATTTDAHRVEVERPGIEISITKTTRDSPVTLTDLYGKKTNRDNWSGYSPHQILCKGFTGDGTNNSDLWRTTGVFAPSVAQRGDWLAEITTTTTWWSSSSGLSTAGGETLTRPTFKNGIEAYEVYESALLSQSGFVFVR